ncbi:MAG: universal stress protein [Chlorobiaceae bacterium]|nr:universal stress protein [Chlorobiaceae bacterium]
MKPISSLLVASDFSADSQHAMQRAALLCKAAGITRGTALHVVETGLLDHLRRLMHLPGEVESTLIDDAMKSLEEASASIFERSGVRLEPQVQSGKSVDRIIEAAAEAELVLLGAKGRHLLHTNIGSTPGRVIRQSAKAVLVVKTEPVQPYMKVLVAVDFSAHSRRAVEWAARVAPTAPLYLVHAYQAMFEGKMKYAGVTEDAISEYRRRARELAESEMDHFISTLTGVNKARIHRMIRHGDHPAQTLVRAIRKTGADLVAVGKQGKTLMEHFLLGSVTLNLLELSPCDLLVTQ